MRDNKLYIKHTHVVRERLARSTYSSCLTYVCFSNQRLRLKHHQLTVNISGSSERLNVATDIDEILIILRTMLGNIYLSNK